MVSSVEKKIGYNEAERYVMFCILFLDNFIATLLVRSLMAT